jgi:uncharacterized protein YqfB (UPF0267 family)
MFKKPFHAAILDGRKTTTLRRWAKCAFKSGDRVDCPGVGVLIVKGVKQIQWSDLGEADAKSDGFESLAELNAAIRKIYPKLDANLGGDGKAWFKLTFRRESPHPRAELAALIRRELDKAVHGNRSLSAS